VFQDMKKHLAQTGSRPRGESHLRQWVPSTNIRETRESVVAQQERLLGRRGGGKRGEVRTLTNIETKYLRRQLTYRRKLITQLE